MSAGNDWRDNTYEKKKEKYASKLVLVGALNELGFKSSYSSYYDGVSIYAPAGNGIFQDS